MLSFAHVFRRLVVLFCLLPIVTIIMSPLLSSFFLCLSLLVFRPLRSVFCVCYLCFQGFFMLSHVLLTVSSLCVCVRRGSFSVYVLLLFVFSLLLYRFLCVFPFFPFVSRFMRGIQLNSLISSHHWQPLLFLLPRKMCSGISSVSSLSVSFFSSAALCRICFVLFLLFLCFRSAQWPPIDSEDRM